MNLLKDVFVIAVIILSICASAEGIGCTEPVVKYAKFEFSDSPGEDGHYPHDTMISVRCSMGSTIQGNRFVICLETDTWDTLPTCTRTSGIGCPEPIIKYAEIEYSDSPGEDGLYPRDTVISVQCPKGSTIQGNRFVSCLETDTWDTLPNCTCTKGNARCPNPPKLWNGRIVRIGGRKAIVICNRGFTLHGSQKITCTRYTAAGVPRWQNTECRARNHCNNPGNLPGADWTLVSADRRSNNESSQFSPNTKISITCRPGLGMVGKPKVKCGMDGRWNPAIPTCETNIRCPQPPKLRNGQITRIRSRKAVVSCNKGFTLQGPKLILCTNTPAGFPHWPNIKCRGSFDFDDNDEVAESLGNARPDSSTSVASSSRGILHSTYFEGHEIYFLFDASGSIQKADFEAALFFAMQLVRTSGVGTTRYATCVYATSQYCSLNILDQQYSVEDVLFQLDALADLRGSDVIGRGSSIGNALRYIHEDLIPLSKSFFSRPAAKTVIFLFSDGHSNMGADPQVQAQILRDDYLFGIYCIGVGREINRLYLQDIASEPITEHLFLMEQYRDPHLLIQILTHTELDFSRCGFNGDPVIIPKSSKGRISGGEDAQLYEWPWQVALYCETGFQQVFFCGGTLIASNWVLTAANCLMTRCNWSHIRVYVGVTDRSTITPVTNAFELDGEDALIVHESFSSSLVNNIALLRLRGFSTLTPEVGTICMPQGDMTDDVLYSPNGGPSYVTGWGVTTPYDLIDNCYDFQAANDIQDRLKQLVIPLVSDTICIESLHTKNSAYRCITELDFYPNETFCAGYREGGRDACKGDSGGPVMRELMMSDGSKRWVQIGIVSWGEGCAQEGRYGFYTRLSRYIGWIQQHVGNSILI